MRFFIDTEFIDPGNGLADVRLISLGVVADNGDEFYAIDKDYPEDLANDWVKQNVLPRVRKQRQFWKSREAIAQQLQDFVDARSQPGQGRPEFWGYFCSSDWLLVGQLYGSIWERPPGWPQLCHEIATYAKVIGASKSSLPPMPSTAHDALVDARWTRDCFHSLETFRREGKNRA